MLILLNNSVVIMTKRYYEDQVGKIKLKFLCKLIYKVTDLQIRNFLRLKNRPLGLDKVALSVQDEIEIALESLAPRKLHNLERIFSGIIILIGGE